MPRHFLFFAIPPLIIAVDMGIKQWVLGFFKNHGQSVPLGGDFLRLTYVENRGILFGLFAQAHRGLFSLGLTLLLAGVFAALAAFYGKIDGAFLPPARPWARGALMFILGGGIGNNLIDRPLRGFVVDYLDFGFGSRRFYVFNFADICIVGGCLLLALLLSFYEQKIS